MIILHTERLLLEPMGLPMVEAVLRGDRQRAEELAGARFPAEWPGPALVERAFTAHLEEIQREPHRRLWGDRLMIARDGTRRIVGSVVFHGWPEDGVAQVGYGVEQSSQGQGLATEATRECVRWALRQDGIRAVQAKTFSWHKASIRVLEKIGMAVVGTDDHEYLGEMLIFETTVPPPG